MTYSELISKATVDQRKEVASRIEKIIGTNFYYISQKTAKEIYKAAKA